MKGLGELRVAAIRLAVPGRKGNERLQHRKKERSVR